MIKIISAIALMASSLSIPAFVSTAQAQSGTYTCVATSPYATGYGQSYNVGAACQRALYECSLRTPVGFNCYVTNRWFNY